MDADDALAQVFDALKFAAHKHRDQRRKGASAAPYVNHIIEVTETLIDVGQVRDTALICAALLHDTVEDTDATDAEVRERFGEEVADLVAEVSDDKSLPKADRKRLQVEHAPHKSPRAKLLKLADKICNVRDLRSDRPPSWSAERVEAYYDWAEAVVAGLRGEHEGLEALFDEVVAQGRAASR